MGSLSGAVLEARATLARAKTLAAAFATDGSLLEQARAKVADLSSRLAQATAAARFADPGAPRADVAPLRAELAEAREAIEAAPAVEAELIRRGDLAQAELDTADATVAAAFKPIADRVLPGLFEDARKALAPIVERASLLRLLGVSDFDAALSNVLAAGALLGCDLEEPGKSEVAREVVAAREVRRSLSAAREEIGTQAAELRRQQARRKHEAA